MKEKIKFILTEISKQNEEKYLIEVLENSEFIYENHWNQETFPNAYNLLLKLSPNIYTKHNNSIIGFAEVLRLRINNSSILLIDKLNILPDYDKIVILNSEVSTVITLWE